MKKTNLIVLLAFVLVLCCAFAACAPKEKANNSISGLTDITATCGDTVPELKATAEYGEVAYGLAKAVEGTAKESLTYGAYSGTLTHGTYYVKATVAEGDDYKAAEAYAKITVNHQAFDKIAGNGETRHETTADGKYRIWTEKKCACGETVIGNESITDKLPATISGIADIDNAKCGYVVVTNGITSDKGTLTFAIATATEGTAKEDLTYAALGTTSLTAGVYYLKASVAEGEDFGAATAYAKITVAHKSYDEIDGEATFVAPVFDTQTKGYYKKQCACGQDVKGTDEYVAVRVTVDGTALDDQVVVVGGKLAVPTDLPKREGYTLTLLNGSDEFDFTAETINDFATYTLTASYVATEVRNGKIGVGANSAWLLVLGAVDYITEETGASFDQKDGYVEVKACFLPENETAGMELNLGSGVLDAYHTYKFTFKATQGTFVWFGKNFDNGKFTYTDAMAAENTVVEVVLTCVDGNLVASFNGTEINCGKASNIGTQTLCFQDKDGDLFANRGTRYTITVSEVVSTYNYNAEAKSILATIPADEADVNIDNAFDLNDKIALFDEVVKYFSTYELATLKVNEQVRAKVAQLVSDHNNIANNIVKDLPAFDEESLAEKTEAELDELYRMVTKYVGYVKTMFTDEELAAYTESKEISLYRNYFAANNYVIKNVISNGKTEVVAPDFSIGQTNIRVTAAGKHTVTLPVIPLAAYSDVNMYIRVMSDEAATLSVGEGAQYIVDNTRGNWSMLHMFIKDGKWVATISHPDDGAKATPVEIGKNVVAGIEGFTFTVENTAAVTVDFTNDHNKIFGTQIATDVSVHKVEYKYATAAGDKQSVKYYIDGEKLVMPQIDATFENNSGTNTFRGWFAGETQHNADEIVSGDITLVAKFEITRYNEFSVTYYMDDTVTKYGEAQIYHYGDKLVLPEAPTKAGEGTKQFAFLGWYDADGKEYKGGEEIVANLELSARFNEMTVEVNVVLTSLDGEDIVAKRYMGSKFDKPENPVREGFTFIGWYTTAGEPYDFDTLLGEEGLTLVAKWYKNSTEPEKVLYTASELIANKFINGFSEPEAKNIADLNEKKETWCYDYDYITGKIDLYSTVAVMYAVENVTQHWVLPKIAFDNYKQLEFAVMSAANKDVVVCGTTFAPKSNMAFVIKDGKLNVYDFPDHYNTPVVSIDLPAEVRSGEQSLEIQFAYNNGTRVLITEFHGTVKYIDYIAEAARLNVELDAWINANVSSASSMTDEQKVAFANKLNGLYIARASMTAYESNNNKIADSVLSLQEALAGLGKSYFELVAGSEMAVGNMDKDSGWNKENCNRPNYGSPYLPDPMNYQAFSTTNATATITLPAINFEKTGMAMQFGITLTSHGGLKKENTDLKLGDFSFGIISVSSRDDASGQWGFVMSIEKNSSGNWIAKLYGDSPKSVELTDAQVNGTEALVFTINISTVPSSGWILRVTSLSATF